MNETGFSPEAPDCSRRGLPAANSPPAERASLTARARKDCPLLRVAPLAQDLR